MKTDVRTRYTLSIIQEVFLKLLQEKPLYKITVKEICEKAQINRGTFYRHYLDVYDLMEKLEELALERFKELLEENAESGKEALARLLASIRTHRELIEGISRNTDSSRFMQLLSDTCIRYARSSLYEDRFSFMDDLKSQYVYSYMVGGISQMIGYWLKNGCEESPQEIADMLTELNDVCMAQVAVYAASEHCAVQARPPHRRHPRLSQ